MKVKAIVEINWKDCQNVANLMYKNTGVKKLKTQRIFLTNNFHKIKALKHNI